MKYVDTVTGQVPVEELGFTLMHEHLIGSGAGIPDYYPQLYRPDWFNFILDELKELKANGISTMVDAGPFDLGRDVKSLKKLSEASGMNIICITGIFFDAPLGGGHFKDEQIAQLFIDECEKGIGDTGIKAGMIKAVMDMEGPTPTRCQQHHAAGIASNETGKPVFMHSVPQIEAGRHQLALLKEVGTDFNRVKLDHILETTDMDYIKWVYDQGVWIGVERLPRVRTPQDPYGVGVESRIQTIKNMIDAGMSDRMLFSHDMTGISPIFDTLTDEEYDWYRKQAPGHWLFLKNYVFKKLEEMGVDPELLNKMAIDNPKRFFEGCKK